MRIREVTSDTIAWQNIRKVTNGRGLLARFVSQSGTQQKNRALPIDNASTVVSRVAKMVMAFRLKEKNNGRNPDNQQRAACRNEFCAD
jgi:hypothetical protein